VVETLDVWGKVTSSVSSAAVKVLEMAMAMAMAMMILLASASPVPSDDRHGAGVGHGEDHDVAGRGGAKCPGRGPAAERVGKVLGLSGVTADDLDGVAALDRASALWRGRRSRGRGC
jgi:hypothetical protein